MQASGMAVTKVKSTLAPWTTAAAQAQPVALLHEGVMPLAEANESCVHLLRKTARYANAMMEEARTPSRCLSVCVSLYCFASWLLRLHALL